MLEYNVSPEAGPCALQRIQVGVLAEGLIHSARNAVADFPQHRVPRRPGKDPLQYLQTSRWQLSSQLNVLIPGNHQANSMS